MNRFTKDLGTIDELLPLTLWCTAANVFMMFQVLIAVIASKHYLAIPALFFLIVLWMLRGFYLKSSRALKHLEAKGLILYFKSTTIQSLTFNLNR